MLHRSLQFTQDCYNRVTKSCASSDSNLKMISRLPEASLTALRDRWGCVEQTEESPEVPVCSEGCQLEKAEECITTLSASLQFWGLRDGDACRWVAWMLSSSLWSEEKASCVRVWVCAQVHIQTHRLAGDTHTYFPEISTRFPVHTCRQWKC